MYDSSENLNYSSDIDFALCVKGLIYLKRKKKEPFDARSLFDIN